MLQAARGPDRSRRCAVMVVCCSASVVCRCFLGRAHQQSNASGPPAAAARLRQAVAAPSACSAASSGSGDCSGAQAIAGVQVGQAAESTQGRISCSVFGPRFQVPQQPAPHRGALSGQSLADPAMLLEPVQRVFDGGGSFLAQPWVLLRPRNSSNFRIISPSSSAMGCVRGYR